MISIIICSTDAEKLRAVRAMYTSAVGNEPCEIISVTDARSLAEGFTRGIAASKGDIVVFSHDDVEVLSPDLPGHLKKHLATYDVVGVAGTSKLIDGLWIAAGPPHLFGQVAHLKSAATIMVEIYGAPRPIVGNIQALDGVFFAVNRSVLEKVSFDAKIFDGFHQYDIDFTYACHVAGLKLAVACDINLLHASMGDFAGDWKEYAARFRRKWLPNVPSPIAKRFQWTVVQVASKSEAAETMHPPHWNWPTNA